MVRELGASWQENVPKKLQGGRCSGPVVRVKQPIPCAAALILPWLFPSRTGHPPSSHHPLLPTHTPHKHSAVAVPLPLICSSHRSLPFHSLDVLTNPQYACGDRTQAERERERERRHSPGSTAFSTHPPVAVLVSRWSTLGEVVAVNFPPSLPTRTRLGLGPHVCFVATRYRGRGNKQQFSIRTLFFSKNSVA